MSHISDLVRTLRASPQRVDEKAAGALLAKAKAEGASPGEVQELAKLLSSELGDKFSPQLKASLATFVDGYHPPADKPVADLLPDLRRLATPKDVAARLGPDFVLLSDQLLGGSERTPLQKAERLLDFVLAYGERFVALASGEAPVLPKQKPAEVLNQGLTGKAQHLEQPQPTLAKPLSAPERQEAMKQFAHALRQNGFGELVDANTRKDAVATLVHLIAAQDVPEFHRRAEYVRFEYPHAQAAAQANPDGPTQTSPGIRALVAKEIGEAIARDRPRVEAERGARMDVQRVQPWQAEAGRVVVAPVQREAASRTEDAVRAGRGTDKVLGRNMLWNVLHTFRDGDRNEQEAREAMNQLTVGAVMILGAITIVAVVLVAL